MSRTRRTPMKIVIAALGATVALAPSASARVLDAVPLTASPDVQSSQDLRSPDARDVAAAQSSRWQAYDEAVRHLTPAQQAAAFVPRKAAPASAPSSDDRVDPRIAVGGVLAALLLGLRGLILVARRRNASAPAVSS